MTPESPGDGPTDTVGQVGLSEARFHVVVGIGRVPDNKAADHGFSEVAVGGRAGTAPGLSVPRLSSTMT